MKKRMTKEMYDYISKLSDFSSLNINTVDCRGFDCPYNCPMSLSLTKTSGGTTCAIVIISDMVSELEATMEEYICSKCGQLLPECDD